jgi:ketosteroid isomerase-like protein
MSKNYEAIKAHYAGSDAGDLAAMMAPITDSTAWTEMAGFPYAGTYIGKAAILEGVFGRIGEEWDGFSFTLDRLIDGGSTVVALGAYSGTYRKTGRKMSARVVHVWDMEDGKAVRFEQFADTNLVALATG